MIEYRDGIHIKGTNFWLDAKRKVDFSFVSHAHTDHAVRHKDILATRKRRDYMSIWVKTKTDSPFFDFID
jgi:Cft2 family RNA processing exonuclease